MKGNHFTLKHIALTAFFSALGSWGVARWVVEPPAWKRQPPTPARDVVKYCYAWDEVERWRPVINPGDDGVGYVDSEKYTVRICKDVRPAS